VERKAITASFHSLERKIKIMKKIGENIVQTGKEIP